MLNGSIDRPIQGSSGIAYSYTSGQNVTFESEHLPDDISPDREFLLFCQDSFRKKESKFYGKYQS